MLKFLMKFILLIVVIFAGYFFVQNYILNDKDPDFISAINTSTDSTIAMVTKAPNGEGLVVFTKSATDKTVDKIVFQNKDGEQGLIDVDENGLPKTYSFNGYTATFSNYTATAVDISVATPGGTTQTLTQEPLNLPKERTSLINKIIPSVSAQSNFGPGNVLEYVNNPPKASTGPDAEQNIHEYILASPGTALNVISCGVGLGSILFSGGATSPLAYFGCAALFTRVITVDTEIGPCEGDILDCAKDAVVDSFNEPNLLAGKAIDQDTGTWLSAVSVELKNKAGVTLDRHNTGLGGGYTLTGLSEGAYIIAVGGNYIEAKQLNVAVLKNRIKIVEAATGKSVLDVKPDDFNTRFNIMAQSKYFYDGSWSGRAISTVDSENECGNADFTLNISKGNVTGKITTLKKYPVKLTGSVDGNGKIVGGVNVAKWVSLGKYSGNLANNSGSGKWNISFADCSGTLTLQKR
jgi:hypothetical protein